MFKHYLWVIHFFALPLGAYLMADMINQMVGSRLEASIKPMQQPAPSLSLSGTVARRNYSEIVEGNIFNAKLRGRNQEETAPIAPQVTYEAIPVDLKVTLMGTVVQDGIENVSYAILEHQVNREQVLYRLGDSVENVAKIVKIDRNEVTLQVGSTHRTLRLYLEEEQSGAGTVPGIQAGQQGPGEGVVKVTPSQWVLDRQEITAALDNLPQLLTKARVIPNFSGGQPDGFRIFSIVPNSFFAKIGLQNGDVLQRINGIEIKDPENFMSVFQQLKGETSVTLDLVRNNQKQTFAYEIR
jgi:general secretion pathway protein C